MPKSVLRQTPSFSAYPLQTKKAPSGGSLSAEASSPRAWGQQSQEKLDKFDDFLLEEGEDQDIQIDESPFIYMCKMSKKITRLRTANKRLRHYNKDLQANMKSLETQNQSLKSLNCHQQATVKRDFSDQVDHCHRYQSNVSLQTLPSSQNGSRQSRDGQAQVFKWVHFDREQSIFLDDQIHKSEIALPMQLQLKADQAGQDYHRPQSKSRDKETRINDFFSQNGSLCTISEQSFRSSSQEECNLDENFIKNTLKLLKTEERYGIPNGIILIREDTVAIWRSQSAHHIFNYLRCNQNITKIIIHDQQFATEDHIISVLKNFPSLTGLYIYCHLKINPSVIEASSLSYYSFFHDYSNLDEYERMRHFSRNPSDGDLQVSNRRKYQFYMHSYFFFSLKNKTVYLDQLKYLGRDVQELNLVSYKAVNPVVSLDSQLLLSKLSSLQILSLTRIFLPFKVKFEAIFKQNHCLHTFALNNCTGNIERTVFQLSYLRKDQLKHLMLRGDGEHRRISIVPASFYQLFDHVQLRTLVLQNVQFFKHKFDDSDRRQLRELAKVPKLTNLVHLNLYGSQAIVNRIAEVLNNHHHKNIQILNIGNARLNNHVISMFSKLEAVRRLSLKNASIQSHGVMDLIKGMDKLEQLSLEMDEVDWRTSKKQNSRQQVTLTSQLMNQIAKRDIRYLNICGCSEVISYDYRSFKQLQCISVQKGLFAQEDVDYLRRRGVKVIEKEGVGRRGERTESKVVVVKELDESEQNITIEVATRGTRDQPATRQECLEEEVMIVQKHKWKCYLNSRLEL